MMFFERFREKGKTHNNSYYNQLPNDIRMKKISLEEALDFLQSLKEQWIYIKYINYIYINNENQDANIYTKFKIKEILREKDFIRLCGNEEKDNLHIHLDRIKQTERTDNCDEIRLVVNGEKFFSEIYIKKYLPNAENRYNEIINTDKHIIITEGKTDWKILKKALKFFQSNGRYNKLDVEFFEFESDVQMGENKAYTVCKYNALFSNSKMRIFLFDSDVESINEEHKNLKFKQHGNNVYSFILPIPNFRKETPLISIENYFSDDEIRTEDTNERRLYLVNEFDAETGKHKSIGNIYSPIGKDKQPNHILDQKVFKIEEVIHDKSEIMKCNTKKNIALSKSDFANNIYNEIGKFKNISLENFSLVFDVIEEIYADYYKSKNNEIEISDGVYLEKNNEDFEVLSIHIGVSKEKAILIRKCDLMSNTVYLDGKNLILDIVCNGIGFKIPIMITEELIDFLEHKIQNNFNRIELHTMDENTQEYISHKELFSSEISVVLFTKILKEIKYKSEN